jgi:hypothetical protein
VNPHHVVALALVGWYLMMPPVIPDTHRVNRDAPLSQWKIAHKFPQNAGCENAKQRAREAGLAAQALGHENLPRRGGNPDLTCVRCAAQCVEDNDPRLKST